MRRELDWDFHHRIFVYPTYHDCAYYTTMESVCAASCNRFSVSFYTHGVANKAAVSV